MDGKTYELFDTIILKDGRVGCIVDISGDVGYIVDVGSSPKDWETLAIRKEDVQGLADKKKCKKGVLSCQ